MRDPLLNVASSPTSPGNRAPPQQPTKTQNGTQKGRRGKNAQEAETFGLGRVHRTQNTRQGATNGTCNRRQKRPRRKTARERRTRQTQIEQPGRSDKNQAKGQEPPSATREGDRGDEKTARNARKVTNPGATRWQERQT